MGYDIIFVLGEKYFDHPLCGVAILKRLLEKHDYTVGVIEQPQSEEDVKKLGKPKLFFGVSSGCVDSMVRNYTPMKKKRTSDTYTSYSEIVPDRAVIVYTNWVKKNFKDSIVVLGGTEASLRRFVHYDYWDNKLRKPILFDSKVNLLVYGGGEKQVLEISERLRNEKSLEGVRGTCVLSKEVPEGFVELPSYEEVMGSKERFCDMQNMFNNGKLAQKVDNRYVLQYESPEYTSEDLDEYYGLPFDRKSVSEQLRGFEFSVVTHRGCIGGCNFCSIKSMQGDKIISRSEGSILDEVARITKMPHFKGNIDDFGGPSANMYGMDCNTCNGNCIECGKLDRTHGRLISLLRKARAISGVKNVFVRSGIRYDLVPKKYLEELVKYHTSGKLKIAPEHVNSRILRLMNKNRGDLRRFVRDFNSIGTKNQLWYYFITAHPGSSMKEARELARSLRDLKNVEKVQVFTPTPMTVSTCMYYTGMDPKTKEKIFVPYTYSEKKEQKNILYD